MPSVESGGGIAASEQRSDYKHTDIFWANQNGPLKISWVTCTKEWQGPIEVKSPFLPPAYLASARRGGI